MKLWILIFIPLFLCTALPAYADGVSVEAGQGIFHSADSRAIFLGYQMDSSLSIYSLNLYYKGAVGSWNGHNANNTAILALGILLNLPHESYICFEPGGAYVEETTDNLGTNLQFALRFAAGMKFDKKIDISLAFRHFSNGDGIFDWSDTPNFGENFLTLQAAYLF